MTVFILYSLCVLVAGSIMNNVRGGTIIPELKFMDHLPKSTYWLWVFVFPLAFLYGFNWQISLFLAVGSFIWALPPWSRWASMYHRTPAWGMGRPVSRFEHFIDTISFDNMYLGLFNRHIVCLTPVVLSCWWFVGASSLWLFLLAPVSVLGYKIGWWLTDSGRVKYPFPTGEFVTGFAGALGLVLMHLFSIGTTTFFS